MNDIILQKIDSSNWELELLTFLRKAHEMGWFCKLKNHLVIKPNLCTISSPRSAATTDVRTVDLLITFFRNLLPSLKITIVESDNFERDANEVFRRLGYDSLEEKYGVKLINLTNAESFEILVNDIPYTLNLPRLFLDDFFFVSIALPKTHAYQKITAIYKNQFGCISDKFKEKYHQYLEEVLYTLNNKLMIPDLCIIDGRVGMQGYGPTSGERIESSFIILSRDPTLADLACSQVMGFNPKKIPYLNYACKKMGIKLDSTEIPTLSPNRKFAFIPMWQYRAIRGKIKTTRVAIALNNKAKRIVYIFFRLPSYFKERKMIPLCKYLKIKWKELVPNKNHLINKAGY